MLSPASPRVHHSNQFKETLFLWCTPTRLVSLQLPGFLISLNSFPEKCRRERRVVTATTPTGLETEAGAIPIGQKGHIALLFFGATPCPDIYSNSHKHFVGLYTENSELKNSVSLMCVTMS